MSSRYNAVDSGSFFRTTLVLQGREGRDRVRGYGKGRNVMIHVDNAGENSTRGSPVKNFAKVGGIVRYRVNHWRGRDTR